MYLNVTGVVFETNCELGKLTGLVDPCNVGSFCTEPGSPNLPPPPPPLARSVKAGIILPGSFSGSPKTYTVVFVNPFTDINYSIALSGVDARSLTFQSKSVNGFVVNTNANGGLSGEVCWIATPIGET